MTTKEKMDVFYSSVGKLAEQLDIAAFVMQIQLDENVSVSTWWPGCTDACDNPGACSAVAFSKGAHQLIGRAIALSDGHASIIDGRNVQKN